MKLTLEIDEDTVSKQMYITENGVLGCSMGYLKSLQIEPGTPEMEMFLTLLGDAIGPIFDSNRMYEDKYVNIPELAKVARLLS
jgi:hypothetical protein